VNYHSSRCDHIRRIGEGAATNRRSPSTQHSRYYSAWPRDLCPLSPTSFPASDRGLLCQPGAKQRLYEPVPT